ncbi:MAG TPA: hypothetical protein VM580_15855 [Labilithrix sp.]|nr:hypothetical protein [Labilithrix sp.]
MRAPFITGAVRKLRDKNFDKWLPGYVRDLGRRALRPAFHGPRHLLVAVCDHYEPLWGDADDTRGGARVEMWRTGYPKMAERFRDADGRPPRHSFFFPGEQYRPAFLDALGELSRGGFGEVEVHLHHDGDTAKTLEPQLLKALEDFSRHGHLSRDADGRLRYAFIHGNWALANGRPDGRWCGVDEELPLLFRTGCYADFTFPAGPDECQPNIVNQIYWPTGNLAAKRCYEMGTRAKVGEVMRDRLLLIQGPLGLARRGRIGVRIEYSALTAHDPASLSRVKSWVSPAIHVEGRPEWVFVKLHTHGAPDKQGASLLGEGGRRLHEILTTHYNDGRRFILHYVTAREMFNIAIAAMEGKSGDPNAYRDHVLAPPPVAS